MSRARPSNQTNLDRWFIHIDEMNRELLRSPENLRPFPTYVPASPVQVSKSKDIFFTEKRFTPKSAYYNIGNLNPTNAIIKYPEVPKHSERSKLNMIKTQALPPYQTLLTRNINEHKKVPRKVRNRSANQIPLAKAEIQRENILQSIPQSAHNAYTQEATSMRKSLNHFTPQPKLRKDRQSNGEMKNEIVGGFTTEIGDYAIVKPTVLKSRNSSNSEISRYENMPSDYELLDQVDQSKLLRKKALPKFNQISPTESEFKIQLRSSKEKQTPTIGIPQVMSKSANFFPDNERNLQLDRGSSSSGYYEEFPQPPSPIAHADSNEKYSSRQSILKKSLDVKNSDVQYHGSKKNLGGSNVVKSRSAKESFEELNYWKRLHEQDEARKKVMSMTPPTVEKQAWTISINRENYLPSLFKISVETKVLDLLAGILNKDSRGLNERFALVEKIPHMKIERVLEDDWRVLDQIDVNNLLNGKIKLHIEERNDLYGMFFDAENWLLPFHVDRVSNKMSPFLIREIYESTTRSNDIRIPEFSDYLHVRVGEMRWKDLYSVMRCSGIYSGKRKISKSSDLKRIIGFEKSHGLYTGYSRLSEINAPTGHSFIIKKQFSMNWKTDFPMVFCTHDSTSLNYWYCYIRMALQGKRLWKNYLKRLEIINNPSDTSYSKRSNWSNRSLNKIDNASLNSSIYNHSMSYQSSLAQSHEKIYDFTKSLCHIPGDGEYEESLHLPKLRRSRSAGNWSLGRSNSLTRSLSQIFNFINPNSKHQNMNETSNNNGNVRSVKKKLLGSGPSARRCSRSLKSISAPFSVSSSNNLVNSYIHDQKIESSSTIDNMTLSSKNTDQYLNDGRASFAEKRLVVHDI